MQLAAEVKSLLPHLGAPMLLFIEPWIVLFLRLDWTASILILYFYPPSHR